MIRAYLLAFVLLGLGLGGVVVIASQASGSLASKQAKTSAPTKGMAPQATGPMRARPVAMRPRPKAVDAGVPRPRPMATPDAAVAKSLDAGAPMRPVATPDAAAPAPTPATGPPKHTGPTPQLVVQFTEGSSRVPKKVRRAIRKLVKAHGYKDIRYKLTGYGAERSKPKYCRALAKRRCRRVARLIRKRGVSRRWIDCEKPVYRESKGKPTDAHKIPAWRRVEVRVVKP